MLVKAAILIFWGVMLLLLVQKHYWAGKDLHSFHPRLSDPAYQKLALETGEEWFGIYMRGRKMGYTTADAARTADGYVITEKARMRFLSMGEEQDITITTRCFVRDDFSLQSFIFNMESGLIDGEVRGRMEGLRLHLDVDMGGGSSSHTLELKEKPFLWPNLKRHLASIGMKVGESYAFTVFDPATLSNNRLMITVEGKETLWAGGIEKDVFKLRENFGGMEVYAWVDGDGAGWKEESATGLLLLREPREVALSMGEGAAGELDIVAASAVRSNREIENPRETVYLKVRPSGLPLEGFDLMGGRQRFSRGVIEVRREDSRGMRSYRLPYDGGDEEEFLKPSLLIQSDHPRVREAAERIVRGEEESVLATRMIMEWVHDNLEKRPLASLPSALEVLELRMGDCNEHASLFTALARAAGIPARIVAGLLYSDGNFYYHAWTEVFQGEWVSLDPLLNQFPADATHIRFIEGDLERQVEVARLVGRLKLEVLEYR